MTTVPEMLRRFGRATIQLSNLCPWAERHPKCPVGRFKEKQVLPGVAVMDCLGTLGWAWGDGVRRVLAWHMFNEPTADPRLCMFMREAGKLVPSATQLVWTNGWYLTPGLVRELANCGMGWLVISAHDRKKREFEALYGAAADAGVRWGLTFHPHDDRADWADPLQGQRIPCWALDTDLTVRASGHIGLCCMDCFEQQRFESVVELGLQEALKRSWPEIERLRGELMNGVRTLDVCRACQRGRRGKYV